MTGRRPDGTPNAAIRPAKPGDAVALARVHVSSWQATYAGLVPKAYLDGLDAGESATRWQAHLGATAGERETVLVVERDGEIVGFASIGPSRDGDASGAGELYAIYLLAERWGLGIGRKLMSSALEALHGFGFTSATLWVLDGNERARRFYEAAGFSHDGLLKVDDSRGFPLTELRYRRRLP